MKHLISVFTVAALLSAVACNKVDKDLINKMQSDLAAMEGTAIVAEKASTTLANLATQMNAAPEAMKSGDNPELKSLMEKSGMMSNKLQATMAEYNDLMSKLKTLVADYNAGKIKTEDAKKEYETLSEGLKGSSSMLNNMASASDQIQTAFAKMTADWNAKAEGAAPPAGK